MQRTVLLTLFALALAAGGCSRTKIMEAWSDPAYSGHEADRIAVVGIGPDEIRRRSFEQEFSKLLNERGNDAVPLHSVLPELEHVQAHPDSIDEILARIGCGTVLTARILGTDTEMTYTPGGTYDVPEMYYNSMHNYYYTVYKEQSMPGTWEEKDYVVVETNLYDARSDRLIWAARSETTKTGDWEGGVEDFSKAIIEDLAERGLVR